ncbi:nitrite transporter NirC [Favolaschia claudopus]|uniref:Nitrite transporter NirC n=1 Tax=Favolaschia claudopus TaxID=2862362 RepID=A0AAV9Z118_9AGAR
MDAEQRLRNLRDTYHTFHDEVLSALRTMVGDPPSLNAIRDRALALASAAEMHQAIFPPDEYATLQTSLTDMVTALDLACHDSMDPPDAAPLIIDPQFLSAALDLRGPTGIAPEIGVSARTVRRAALRAGLVQPGAPVFQSRMDAAGEVEVVHTSTAPPVSAISDAELDRLLASTLEVFPQFGRRMIRGHLKSQGYHVPRDRITASRKKYRVPGPMSLAHLDGQHGLIRYKIVIHCIIDGYSRFVLGNRVHNNNRGASVLRLLLDVIALHGCPSRMRGDHGVENIEVAVYMEEVRGSGRGSFIWGRSVHNTRIERLWYDVTHGFGKKWKEWAKAWNSHQLTVRRQRERSPRDLFTFGMLLEGPRGISSFLAAEEEEIEDINEYGIDWEVNTEPELIAHLFENNPHERVNNTDPFASASTPANRVDWGHINFLGWHQMAPPL